MAVQQELWGSETTKAIENFRVSGEPVPAPVVRWLGRIKAEAARVNAELGLLDADIAERVARAGAEVAAGQHLNQFPIDVFQTGSGTSSNMNANEVIANLAGEGAHPNDHVNMGQSSNDMIPTAIHLAAAVGVHDRLLPALEKLRGSFDRKAKEFKDIVKTGRTHLQDATPITLGQEFSGYENQIKKCHRASEACHAVHLRAGGGGHRGGHRHQYRCRVRPPGRGLAGQEAGHSVQGSGEPFRSAGIQGRLRGAER